MLKSLLKNEKLFLSLLAALVLLIYANVLDGPFVFDDKRNIKENPHIRITALAWDNLLDAGLQSPMHRRPVANISFALNYYFHGYDVFGYHLINIIIHAIAGWILFYTIKATFRTPAMQNRFAGFEWVPFFSVCIWMVHPIQTQAVSYIVQRMTSQTALFYILTLYLYILARQSDSKIHKKTLFTGCIFSGILAVGSKEIAATLPFFILLYEWYFFQKLDCSWLKKRAGILAGALLVFGLVAFIYLGQAPLDRIFSGYTFREFTPAERILTQFRVISHYIGLLFWAKPSRLNLDYDFPLSHSLTDPMTTLFALAFIAGLMMLAIFSARKTPMFSFGIFWFFGNLLIESSIIPLELVYEHRLYLPSMFAIAGLVSLLFRYAKPRWLCIAALSFFIGISAFWTYRRNTVWNDQLLLWQDCIDKSPNKARPHNNLGVALMLRDRVDEAMVQYRRALELDPDYSEAHHGLGYILARQGNLAEGIRHLERAVHLKPVNQQAQVNLGIALMLQDRTDEALDHFRKAAELNPDDPIAQNNMGVALRKKGNLSQAAVHLQAAIDLAPGYAEAYNNLGYIYKLSGKNTAAIEHFQKALLIKPDYANARRNLDEMQERSIQGDNQ